MASALLHIKSLQQMPSNVNTHPPPTHSTLKAIPFGEYPVPFFRHNTHVHSPVRGWLPPCLCLVRIKGMRRKPSAKRKGSIFSRSFVSLKIHHHHHVTPSWPSIPAVRRSLQVNFSQVSAIVAAKKHKSPMRRMLRSRRQSLAGRMNASKKRGARQGLERDIA